MDETINVRNESGSVVRASMTNVIVARRTMKHFLILTCHANIFADVTLEAVVGIWGRKLAGDIQIMTLWAFPLRFNKSFTTLFFSL